MQAPGEAHVRLIKRGLRYLRGKLDLGLVYDFSRASVRQGLYGFFDASHADDLDTRRSTIAYAFFYSGCAISWKTKLHTFVTTSTNHSELVASAMAAREAKYVWSLLGALGKPAQADLFAHRALDLFSDSMGVVAVAANNVLSSATKHVDSQISTSGSLCNAVLLRSLTSTRHLWWRTCSPSLWVRRSFFTSLAFYSDPARGLSTCIRQ